MNKELERQDKKHLNDQVVEEEASVGFHNEEVGEMDEFEMNQAEKTETLEEYPVHEAYDGPEPKPVPKEDEHQN